MNAKMTPKTLASEGYYRQRALECISNNKADYYNRLADKAAEAQQSTVNAEPLTMNRAQGAALAASELDR